MSAIYFDILDIHSSIVPGNFECRPITQVIISFYVFYLQSEIVVYYFCCSFVNCRIQISKCIFNKRTPLSPEPNPWLPNANCMHYLWHITGHSHISIANQHTTWTFFSSAWLCQQSSWNQNSSVVHLSPVPPSVRRPSVCDIDYLWGYCMDFFQILVVASPETYSP